jgi:DNA-binding transcriptional ArsR family regulator
MSGELLSRIRREIDARLRELRPAVLEYERLLDAAPAPGRAARSTGRSRSRAAKSTGEIAVLAALEHGSHTISELVVVTALPAATVRESLRRLTRRGAVAKAERDGKSAYALSPSAG